VSGMWRKSGWSDVILKVSEILHLGTNAQPIFKTDVTLSIFDSANCHRMGRALAGSSDSRSFREARFEINGISPRKNASRQSILRAFVSLAMTAPYQKKALTELQLSNSTCSLSNTRSRVKLYLWTAMEVMEKAKNRTSCRLSGTESLR
jgi:hypothetical protein